MRYWAAVLVVMFVFICVTIASADKFGGPKPHKPAPPVDTTLVDSVQYWDEPMEVDTTQVDSTRADSLDKDGDL